MARGPSALSTGRVCGRRGHVVRSGSGNTGVLAAINTPARRAGYIYRYKQESQEGKLLIQVYSRGQEGRLHIQVYRRGLRRAGYIYRYIAGVTGGQVTYTGI